MGKIPKFNYPIPIIHCRLPKMYMGHRQGCNTSPSISPPACVNFNYNEEAPVTRQKTKQSGGTTTLKVTNLKIRGAVASFICRVRLTIYGSPTSLANNNPPTTVAAYYKQNSVTWTHLFNLNHQVIKQINSRHSLLPSISTTPITLIVNFL